MADGSKSNMLLAILVLILASLAVLRVTKNNDIEPRQREAINKDNKVASSLQKGIKNSSTLSSLWKELTLLEHENKIQLILLENSLTGGVVGETSFKIVENSKIIITIKIDSSKIIKSGDFIEPVLGHELKHINNVLFLYDKRDIITSVSTFLNKGSHKEIEASALTTEDVIRKELLNSGSFPNIPITRMDADIRYSIIYAH